MPRALLAITSYNDKFYEDGARTGVFVVEALHPYQVLIRNGFDVDFVSETGTFGWDEHSLAPDFLSGDDKAIYEDKNSDFIKAINSAKKLSDVSAQDYDIFFASAGHGAAYDYPKSERLQKLVADISSNGGVIGAVCHGPILFDKLKSNEGEIFIRNKKITGFTDEGEELLNVDKVMEKMGLKTVKKVAEDNGATYIEPKDPWESFVVVDGNLVTGVNPNSAAETTQKSVDTWKSRN